MKSRLILENNTDDNDTILMYNTAIKRDEKAFQKLYMAYYIPLLNFSMIYIKEKSHSEEIISDVMLNIWQMKDKLLGINNLQVYLFRSIKNRALNYLKEVRKYTTWDIENIPLEHNMEKYTPESYALEKEYKQELYQSIKSLPPQCQLVFKLIREYGMSYKEVAGIMEISEKTVDRHLTIAMQKLFSTLRKKRK